MLRELIVKLLSEKSPPIRFIAAAATVNAAIHTCIQSKADLLLVRVAIITREHESAIARLRKQVPHIKIVLYAGPAATDQHIVRAIRNGVDGCVGKKSTMLEFLDAVNRTYRGDGYFCSDSTRLLSEAASGRHLTGGTTSALSPREIEVLRLIADGGTSKEIAQRLGLSVATVNTHRRNLMLKAGAHNAAELIRYSRRNGLFETA